MAELRQITLQLSAPKWALQIAGALLILGVPWLPGKLLDLTLRCERING